MTVTGLSTTQAQQRFQEFGPNTIKADKPSLMRKLVRWLISPLSMLLLAASVLSFVIGKDFDGWFIFVLFIGNFLIAQWHEAKADQAIETLQKKLTVMVQALRDTTWTLIPSDQLVPGDIVRLSVGNIIPADVTIIACKNLSVNEAALTGESLPQEKQEGMMAYTGSFITTGSLVGSILHTGSTTKFGKTVTTVDMKPKHSILERDILTISRFLTAVSLTAAVSITAYLLFRHQTFSELLTLDVSILIAGIPVAMPTVMSLIISLGVVQLTRKHVIVRRLSSLEDLANVNLLLSDKTGTLTRNEIVVANLISYYHRDRREVIRWAVSATTDNKLDAINEAIITRAKDANISGYTQLDVTPADSLRKRSTALVTVGAKTYTVSLGAPQIVEALCDMDAKTQTTFRADVERAARQGYRSLALAVGEGKAEKHLRLIGILLLSDTVRPDAARSIQFLLKHGIDVKIMTGDNHAIAARVAASLGLRGQVIQVAGKTKRLAPRAFAAASVFAEVLPDDKLRLVQFAARRFVVAATGDGVNDLPALKQASVGIAVNTAVDALKSAADIVLTTNGIGVIRDAIIEARKIFVRTYYYSIYRISESFRLILTIAILSLIYGTFPLTPVQIILLALLNDLPIISLAYDRVTATSKPTAVHIRERFGLASLYGVIGVMESLTLFLLMKNVWHFSGPVLQTMFFLKLAVSGHMLIYVAHTKKWWWQWLPSKPILWATSLTQVAATVISVTGIFFVGITLWQAALVWGWALLWMQVEEVAKQISQRYFEI